MYPRDVSPWYYYPRAHITSDMCIPRMCPRDIIIPLHISPVICVSRVGISVRPYPRHKNILFSVKFLNTVLGTLSRSLIESVGDWLSSRLPPGMKQMVCGNSGDSHISEPSLALFRTGIKQHTKVEYCSARRGMHLSLNSSRDMCNPPPPHFLTFRVISCWMKLRQSVT